MVFTREGFTQVASNAFAGLGFPAESPSIYEFPNVMFLPGSDLTPINENIDKIISGLTKWEPKTKETGSFAPPKLTVTGKDYAETVANMNLVFLKNLWSDGLPILPATEERVNSLLRGTDLSPDTLVGEGKILPRGGIATVETLAVSLAMTGGRPEYMPLLIAAIEAMTDPRFVLQGMNATTCSCFPVVVVNGPVAKEIRLNSGYGCLGPSSQFPAGASIGRAIRFLMVAAGGSIPGVGSMAIHGSPARYTNVVFAEDENGVPEGWKSLAEERGFPKGSNVVTADTNMGTVNLSGGGTSTTYEEGMKNLYKVAYNMRNPSSNYWNVNPWAKGSPGFVLLPPLGAQGLAEFGWSQDKVKSFLWEASKMPWSEVVESRSPLEIEKSISVCEGLKENEPWPITSRPENITLVVAGGYQGGHFYWMQNAWPAQELVSAEIQLPAKAKWDAVLKEAETDLGPIPGM